MKHACASLVFVLGGCGFATTVGPTFAPVASSDTPVVYLYRPNVTTGALKVAHVFVDGEERLLLMGSYAALAVTPGHHTVYAYSTYDWQYFVGYGYGPTGLSGRAEFDAMPGGRVYVRVVARLGPVEVTPTSPETARAEIAACGLAPGGALR